MCSPVKCPTCGKTTWSGCGRHVDALKRRILDSQWCDGHKQAPSPRSKWWSRA
ncbi:hypothetical protein CNO18_16120 [Gordonia sp. 1D]|nr:hypothetical protein CNO18_16120 [Gordonia sp. 1D]